MNQRDSASKSDPGTFRRGDFGARRPGLDKKAKRLEWRTSIFANFCWF